LPSLILWAWERPERLDFIDSSRVGVAYLATTLYLRGDKVLVRPRLQPLNVPLNTSMIAVARIESARTDQPSLSKQQIDETVAAVAALAGSPRIVAVQIDFDATLSEREFYQQVLFRVRSKLPASTALSITALASWCKGDNWLDDLPIDEAVPMLFRMGIEESQIREQLLAGEKFSSVKCQNSVGLSTDEPLLVVRPVARTYFFNPRSWTATSVKAVSEKHETQQTVE
jgi:hypothetical protein